VDDVPDPVAVVRVRVRGLVQGVGFRWWAREQLSRLGLTGSAANLADGSVEIVARGDPGAIAALVAAVRGPDTPGWVDAVEVVRDGRA
jgi:acylphosphatase